ncbi:MAG: carboxypeptidase regulatory-like domain-containing protein, partial [Acidobacteriota bacterium]|nr:carboxypeptidase regulatory-like domain-containing protein [Acidobacteriota bacterium]
ITVSYVWDLPHFSNRNLLMREAAGGWQLTGIIRRQSATPLTLTAGSDRSQTGLNTDRALKVSSNVYGGSACAKVSSACVNYLDPTAFVTVYTATSYPLGTYGNTGKGQFSGPSFITWDVGMLKNFALTPSERVRMQFHAEFFNVLNHTNLNNPTTAANSANFGNIQSSQDPRIGQLALKVIF